MRCSTKHLHPFNQAGGVQLYSNTAVPVCRLQDLPECGMHCRPWLAPSSSRPRQLFVRRVCCERSASRSSSRPPTTAGAQPALCVCLSLSVRVLLSAHACFRLGRECGPRVSKVVGARDLGLRCRSWAQATGAASCRSGHRLTSLLSPRPGSCASTARRCGRRSLPRHGVGARS